MKDFYRNIDPLGRIVIPKEIRKANGISDGDALSIRVTKDGILLSAAKSTCISCGESDKPITFANGKLCHKCAVSIAREVGMQRG